MSCYNYIYGKFIRGGEVSLLLEFFKASVLGIIEGITEWLPVSSTGHLILANEFINLQMSQQFMNIFNVVIQLGAILAVLIIFFNKLNPLDKNKTKNAKKETIELWFKVAVAVVPSGIVGVLFDDYIEAKFFNPFVVSIMLILYGIIMIVLENRNKKSKIDDFKDLSYKTAIGIGLFQCLALIPGTSRSAATIIGATYLGTSRFIAAEFSFFMAIPTMLGASFLKLIKGGLAFNGFEWSILATGTIVSFIVSIIVIKLLMDYIKKHDFKVFGWYRIVLGFVVMMYFFL